MGSDSFRWQILGLQYKQIISESEAAGDVYTAAASHVSKKENKLLNNELRGQKRTETDGDCNE